LWLKNLTITRGRLSGGEFGDGYGAGIRSFGDLSLNGVSVVDNTSKTQGGGLFGTSEVDVSNSTIAYNTAETGEVAESSSRRMHASNSGVRPSLATHPVLLEAESR